MGLRFAGIKTDKKQLAVGEALSGLPQGFTPSQKRSLLLALNPCGNGR